VDTVVEATRTTRPSARSWLLDKDGVLAHEERAIPGADRFLARLRKLELPFLVLTNNSIYFACHPMGLGHWRPGGWRR
jgi:ribonucleotide monophosphatase NagD (HAD superfamily)